MKHAVFLCPPFDSIVIRDNFCSKTSQAAYINHPIDFVMQSGRFSEIGCTIHLIDAVVDRLSPEECIRRIASVEPEIVYTLTGNASWDSDLQFFRTLRAAFPRMRLAAGGDVFLEDPVRMLEQFDVFDALVMDYTIEGLTDYLSGRTPCRGMIYRNRGQIVDDRAPRPSGESFEIPLPLHALFSSKDYRYPFILKHPFATVMTEFGCPFHCAFCVMGTLGWRRRPIDNVMHELQAVRALGIRDVFFIDQSFASDRNRAMELCGAIEQALPDMRWLGFSRVDLLDEELLLRMKRAGCHTLILGVETASPELLERYRKGYTLEQVRTIFSMLSRLRIRSVATFLLGLPGETWDSAVRTIEFARDLACDFASINIAAPRMGTDLRKWAVEAGLVPEGELRFDQSGSRIVMSSTALSAEDLAHLKKLAVRRIYLRPRYVLKRLLALRSIDEFRIQSREALQLVINHFRSLHH